MPFVPRPRRESTRRSSSSAGPPAPSWWPGGTVRRGDLQPRAASPGPGGIGRGLRRHRTTRRAPWPYTAISAAGAPPWFSSAWQRLPLGGSSYIRRDGLTSIRRSFTARRAFARGAPGLARAFTRLVPEPCRLACTGGAVLDRRAHCRGRAERARTCVDAAEVGHQCPGA